jgi:hypothetical protein
MAINQQTQGETQEDINARLALISKAVEAKLGGRQKVAFGEEVTGREQDVLVANTCPIDPMERLLCESCQ